MSQNKPRIQVIIDPEAHKQLKLFAVNNEMSVSDVVRLAMQEFAIKHKLGIDMNVPQWGGKRERGGR